MPDIQQKILVIIGRKEPIKRTTRQSKDELEPPFTFIKNTTNYYHS